MALAAMLACAPALAQPPETPLDVTVVEELVARPLTPGPAWWRVADADSSVWIMTAPCQTPRNFDWDRSVLERRLDGANQYISPIDMSLLDPRSVIGIGGLAARMPAILLAARKKPEPRPTGPLEARLSPEERDRFVAMRERLGQPADRYAAMTPLEAARAISQDFNRQFPLADMDVPGQVESVARRYKVRITPAYKARIPTHGYKVEVQHANPAHGQACLDQAIIQLEDQRSKAQRIAAAWARGDVRPMLVAGSPLANTVRQDLDCVNMVGATLVSGSPVARGLDEEYVRSQVAVIERALKAPGRSVALLPLQSPFGHLELGLLGRKGVLERLRTKGYQITTPAEPGGS